MKKTHRSQKKLIVLGLDSATLKILEPLVHRGLLPTFKKCMQQGAYGILESTIPPITPCAWESSVTGVNPGKHNIFDFFSYKKDYEVDVLTSSDRSSLAVWDFLGFANKKTIVFNYPMGYPPKKIEGIFVSGMNTPGVNAEFTYPTSIKSELLRKVPSYRIDVLGDHIINGREDLYFEDILRLTIDHAQAAEYLLKKYSWELACIFLTQLDRVHHYFYYDLDESHPINKLRKKRNRIVEYYKLLDNILQKMLADYPNASFLIFSDHGTESLHNDIFIEKYLEEWGLLTFKKTYRAVLSKFITEFFLTGRKVAYKLRLAQRLLRLLPGDIFSLLVHLSAQEGKGKEGIDWKKTRVYFPTPSSQGLRINLAGREEEGIVKEKDYNSVRNYVIEQLSKIKDPRTGEKIIKHVYKREDIYKGPYVQNAQDLIIDTESKYHLQKGIRKGKMGLASEGGVPKSAEHGREGMYIYYKNSTSGKKLRKREKIQIVDIAPSILYILGLQIPKSMEGRARKEIFVP